MRAQTVVIARRCNCAAEEILILIDTLDKGG